MTPQTPFTLDQLTQPSARPRRWPVRWIVAGAAAVALASGGAAAYVMSRPDLPVKDGIRAPHADCTSDVQSLDHPWIRSGWWAGYMDDQPTEMVASDAAALNATHKMYGVWLCPPKSEW